MVDKKCGNCGHSILEHGLVEDDICVTKPCRVCVQ